MDEQRSNVESRVISLILTRVLDPLIKCFKQLTRSLGLLFGEVVPLSLILVQTIEFGLVLLHVMDELPAVLQDRLADIVIVSRGGLQLVRMVDSHAQPPPGM